MGKLRAFIPLVVGIVVTGGIAGVFAGFGAAWGAAATIVAGIAVQGYERRRAIRQAREAFNAGLKDRLISWPLVSDGARSRVYGRVRNVDGTIFVASHGVNDEFLTVFVALAGHEIDGVEKIFLNDICVEGAEFTAGFSSGPGFGATSATLSANWARATGAYAVTFSNGDERAVTFTINATTATWTGGLSSAAATNFTYVGPDPGGPRLNAAGYVQVPPYNRTDNPTLSATIQITAGNGSVVLPQTPNAGSVAVMVTTTVDAGDGSTTANFSLAAFTTVSGATVTVTGATFPTGAVVDGFGTVTYQISESTSYVRIRKYLGALGQNISNDLYDIGLVSLIVPGQHRFDNIAGLLVTMEFSPDPFPGGQPPHISAVFRGAKCTDPRTGAFAWTENSAVIGFDWARYQYGGGLLSAGFDGDGTVDELDLASFQDAANACDVSTVFSRKAIGGEILPDIVGPRYTCGIVAKTDSNAGDVFEEIVASMAGQYGWSGGKLRVRAGAWRAPVATITEDWVSDKEAIAIQPAPGLADTFNILRPSISDAARDYAFAPVPQVRSEPYITADGQELSSEITLSGVTQAFRAQDICEVLLLEGRQAMTVTLPCNMRAFVLDLFDVIEVTLPHYGWTDKHFEIRGWRFSALGGVILLLREVSAASYDVATLFTIDDLSDNTELPKPWIVNPVEGFAVTSTAALSPDSQIVTRTLATWLPHSQAAVLQNGRIEIQWLDLIGQPQTVQWINANGDIATWEDDDGSGVEWVSGGGMVPVLMTWTNTLGAMTWTNDVETTLEWYQEVGAPVIPLGDWRAKFEPGGGTSTEIAALSPGHIYLFRARAINSINVKSAWNTQVSIKIPDTPLIQTSGIAIGAVTEVFVTPSVSDSWTTAFTGIQIRQLAHTTYTNTTAESVEVELTLTALRRITSPASASNLDIVVELVVIDTPEGSTLPSYVGPGAPNVNYVEDMGPSETAVFNESHTWKVTVDAGHTVQAYSEIRVAQGAYSGVTVDTSNLVLRRTIVLR